MSRTSPKITSSHSSSEHSEEKPAKKVAKNVPCLRDVLKKQLYFPEYTNRGTQTEWKWAVMAKRWKHARLIAPSFDPPPPKHSLHSVRSALTKGKSRSSFTMKVSSIMNSEKDKLSLEQEHAHQHRKSSKQHKTTQRHSEHGHFKEEHLHNEVKWRQSHSTDEEPTDDKDTEQTTDMTSEEESRRKHSVRDSIASDGKQEGSNSSDDDIDSTEEGAHKIHKRRNTYGDRRHSRRKTKPNLDDGKHRWILNKNDKIVDTVDLVFDPYDPELAYTPVAEKLLKSAFASVRNASIDEDAESKEDAKEEEIKEEVKEGEEVKEETKEEEEAVKEVKKSKREKRQKGEL